MCGLKAGMVAGRAERRVQFFGTKCWCRFDNYEDYARLMNQYYSLFCTELFCTNSGM